MNAHFRKRAPGAQRPGAFTLVELLVVVSIIALLIAILLPSLRKAREQAKLAACMANMTGIGKSGLTYAADDPGENIVPVPDTDVLYKASGALEWGGKSGSGDSVLATDPSISLWGTAWFRGPAHRPMNLTLFKGGFRDYNPPNGAPNAGPGNVNWLNDTKIDLPIYRCPSDTGYAGGGFLYTGGRHARDETPWRDGGLSAYDHFGTSYSANTFWITGGLSGRRIRSQSPYLTPLSRLPAPSETIAYQEWQSRFAWLWGDWTSQCDWAGRDKLVENRHNTIPGWHRQPFRFVVAFSDGHADVVKMKGCIRPPPNLGIQNYPANGCGPSHNAYDCSACVTIRGPGWRMDTLPAVSVLTPYFAD